MSLRDIIACVITSYSIHYTKLYELFLFLAGCKRDGNQQQQYGESADLFHPFLLVRDAPVAGR